MQGYQNDMNSIAVQNMACGNLVGHEHFPPSIKSTQGREKSRTRTVSFLKLVNRLDACLEMKIPLIFYWAWTLP